MTKSPIKGYLPEQALFSAMVAGIWMPEWLHLDIVLASRLTALWNGFQDGRESVPRNG